VSRPDPPSIAPDSAAARFWTAVAIRPFRRLWLVQAAALVWTPVKEAAVPNLLPRDLLETANRLTPVMTYGIAPVAAALVFAAISRLPGWGPVTPAHVALLLDDAGPSRCAAFDLAAAGHRCLRSDRASAGRRQGEATMNRQAGRTGEMRGNRPAGSFGSAGDTVVRLVLSGVGALRSPRYPPAGLLVCYRGHRVMLDGGGGEAVDLPVEAWLVCDEDAEEISAIRARCAQWGITPMCRPWQVGRVSIQPRPVVHTSHPTVGYLLLTGHSTVVWAPEFWAFPAWAAGADLMFADAAGWRRPIRFAGGVGGHEAVADTAEQARAAGVRRLVFAHIGRPSIKARDAGLLPSFGEWGDPGMTFRVR
jgi:Beta-lactamase superfamily domain